MVEKIPDDVLRLGYCRSRPSTPQYRKAYGRWQNHLYRAMRGQPTFVLPWITYEAVIYLLLNTTPQDTVFEWGGGASTVFWRERGNRVTTIETSRAWAERIGVVPVSHKTPEYVSSLDREYDIVVIDGFRRVECFQRARNYARRMIVLDNSGWPEHKIIHTRLSKGWSPIVCGLLARRSPFQNGHRTGKWLTTIFVREEVGANDGTAQ